ncbi:hypothetical protein [Sorangium sp. So ce131]|uniref:hypothetical protein n=1 Tax=Sorangium sp. So ce131 TaxID=3133282 RepID=UPI003F5E7F06
MGRGLARAARGLATAGGAFRSKVKNAGALLRQNTALRSALVSADPQTIPKVMAQAAPSIGTALVLSAADASETGQAIEDVIKVSPSAAALALTLGGAMLVRRGRFRRGLIKTAVGAAHALACRVGSRVPAAVTAALHEAPKTSGVESHDHEHQHEHGAPQDGGT